MDAILRLVLDTQALLRQLSDVVREWVQSTSRMDRAAEGVDFDLAQREAKELEEIVRQMAAGVVGNLAKVEAAAAKAGTDGFGKTARESKQVETAIARLTATADRELAKLERAARRVELQRLRKEAKDAEDAITRMTREADRELAKVEKAAARIQFKQAREEARQVEQAIRTLEQSGARSFAALEARAKAAGVSLQTGIGGALTRLPPQVQSLQRRFEASLAAMRTAADRVSFQKAQSEAQRLEAAIHRMGLSAQRDLDRVRQSALGATTGFAQFGAVVGRLNGILGTLGIFLSARTLLQWAEDAVQASIQLEAFRAQLSASVSTVDEANELFQFANDQTERLGLNFASVVEGTARFSAATKGSNLTLAQRKDILLAVFEASRVLNLSEQRLQNTLLALEQIASKATVSMEELRRQLGDNIPGAVRILADQMGVTQEQLLRMIETNQVLSEEALPLLAKGLRETFGEGVQASIDTTAASIGRLQKELFDLRVAFAEGFGPEFKEGIDDLAESLRDLAPAANLAGKVIGLAIQDVGRQLSALGGYIELVRKTWEVLFEGIPDSLARTAIGIESASDEAEKFAASLSAAADATELASLEIATKAVADAWNDAAQKGELTAEESETLRQVIAKLIERFEEAGEEIPEVWRRIAAEAGVALSEVETAADQVARALENAAERAKKVQGEFFGTEKAAEALADQLRDLVHGLDLDNLTAAQAEAIRDLIEDVKEAFDLLGREVPPDIAEIARQLDALGFSITGVREEVEKLTEELRRGLSELDLDNLSAEQLDALKEKIQEVLDAWALYGEQAPADIQAVADKLGVTTSVVEKELEKQEKAAEKAARAEEQASKRRVDALERIASAFFKLSETIGEAGDNSEISDLEAKLKELEDARFNFTGSLDELDELNAEIENLESQLDSLRDQQAATGESATQMADTIDESIRGLVEGLEPVYASLNTTQQQAIETILTRLQSLGQQGIATGDDVASSLSQMIQVLESAGQPTADLRAALREIETGSLDIRAAFEALREEIAESSEDFEASTTNLQKSTEQLKKDVDEHSRILSRLGQTYESVFNNIAKQQQVVLGYWKEINAECEKNKECLVGGGP